jgi:hypothetical protein
MGCNTSSERRPAVSPLLTPTDNLKQLWLQEETPGFPCNEYRLNGIPESLKAFTDQFLKENGRGYDYNRLIWTSKNSFVRLGFHRLPGVYRVYRFELRLTRSGSYDRSLFIHSSTLEEAMSSFDFLVGLHDDHFEKMEYYHSREEIGPRLCPLTSVLLEKVLQQNAKRKHVFYYLIFSPDQCRTLTTSGTRTDIGLNRCLFQDDTGAAFLEALAARADPQTGLAKLTIWYWLPFVQAIFVLLLHMLECLTLYRIRLESEEACRAVAAAELQCLELYHCKLGDGGASLVESVQVGRGPKELGLYTFRYDDYFDSSERFTSFLNALRGNSHLEKLDLSGFDFREEGVLAALAAALFENKGLAHLGLQRCDLDESGFCKTVRAISTHPSLRTLNLTSINIDMDVTEAVAEMLSHNAKLEEIRIDGYQYCSVWAALITPRLECNVYRKRFHAIQEIRVPSTRAAVLASALAHVRNKPSSAFMLLRQNGDILTSYSAEYARSKVELLK